MDSGPLLPYTARDKTHSFGDQIRQFGLDYLYMSSDAHFFFFNLSPFSRWPKMASVFSSEENLYCWFKYLHKHKTKWETLSFVHHAHQARKNTHFWIIRHTETILHDPFIKHSEFGYLPKLSNIWVANLGWKSHVNRFDCSIVVLVHSPSARTQRGKRYKSYFHVDVHQSISLCLANAIEWNLLAALRGRELLLFSF